MLEIATVGAKVKYAFESTSGQRPTSGYTVLPDVNQAPAQELGLETIDVSNITDKITRYTEGRQDPGGDMEFTLNHTDAVIDIWNALATEAETKFAQGKQLWFEYSYAGSNKSYYWAGKPKALGTSGIEQNSASTIPAHVVLTDWAGWASKSTSLTVSPTTSTKAVNGTETVTVAHATGTVTATSSNPSVATVGGHTGNSWTISAEAVGTAIITFRDENGDEATMIMTVTAE